MGGTGKGCRGEEERCWRGGGWWAVLARRTVCALGYERRPRCGVWMSGSTVLSVVYDTLVLSHTAGYLWHVPAGRTPRGAGLATPLPSAAPPVAHPPQPALNTLPRHAQYPYAPYAVSPTHPSHTPLSSGVCRFGHGQAVRGRAAAGGSRRPAAGRGLPLRLGHPPDGGVQGRGRKVGRAELVHGGGRREWV